MHGHGAKGGAYARLGTAGTRHPRLHAARRQPALSLGLAAGFLYLAAERVLMTRTDLFLFESEYGRDVFREKLGTPAALVGSRA